MLILLVFIHGLFAIGKANNNATYLEINLEHQSNPSEHPICGKIVCWEGVSRWTLYMFKNAVFPESNWKTLQRCRVDNDSFIANPKSVMEVCGYAQYYQSGKCLKFSPDEYFVKYTTLAPANTNATSMADDIEVTSVECSFRVMFPSISLKFFTKS